MATIVKFGPYTASITEYATDSGNMFDVIGNAPGFSDYVVANDGVIVAGLPMPVWHAIAKMTDFEYRLFDGACDICGCKPAYQSGIQGRIERCVSCQ